MSFYWFPVIPSASNYEIITSLDEAEKWQKQYGGTIKTVPILESEAELRNWVKQQDDSELYVFQGCMPRPSEEEMKKMPDFPKKIYFVV